MEMEVEHGIILSVLEVKAIFLITGPAAHQISGNKQLKLQGLFLGTGDGSVLCPSASNVKV